MAQPHDHPPYRSDCRCSSPPVRAPQWAVLTAKAADLVGGFEAAIDSVYAAGLAQSTARADVDRAVLDNIAELLACEDVDLADIADLVRRSGRLVELPR